jgi:acyl-CoA synthetase (AMP-forming)/AMP-acid ligase II
MNVFELFQAQVAARRDAPAIIAMRRGARREFTFGRLEADSAEAAARLTRCGVRQGDAVLVMQPLSYELYVALLALFRLGAVAMFLEPSAGRAHLEQCCAIGAPRAFIGSRRAHWLRLLSSAVRAIPLKFSTGGLVPGAKPLLGHSSCAPAAESVACAPDTPALLTFTSGSTGRPKAAVRTHGFLIAQYSSLARALRLQPGERDLTTLPIFLLANLGAGITSVIPDADLRRPGRVNAGPIVRQIRECGVTRSTGSPAFYGRLVEYCRGRGECLQGLECIDLGGAPVFPPLLQRLRGLAPTAELVSIYGSTEAEPMAHVAWDATSERDRKQMRGGRGLLAGWPVSEARVRIVRDRFGAPIGPYSETEFEAERLPVGEIGEIVVAGDHVLKGYLHGDGDRDHKFAVAGERWHRTGDAGYFDADGRLWLVGRCSGRIEDARGVLYPFTVECAASFVAGVRRSAMVAHAGRRVLLLELEAGAPLPSVEEFGWAGLDEVREVGRIPVDRRHNAKVDYTELRRLLAR